MIEFSYPWVLTLLPVPVLAWHLLPARQEKGAVRVPASVQDHLARHSGAGAGRRIQWPADLMLRTAGWVALIIALAGPYTAQPALLKPTGRDIVVALDLSASMAETDMSMNGRTVARIDVVRDRLSDFLEGRRGDRVALVGFATEAFLIAPLTFDVRAVSEMLGEATIGLPGRKTDLGQAIGLTVKMLRKEPDAERLMILISDGEANAGDLAAHDAAVLAREIGLKIFAVGFASVIEAENAAHMSDLAELTNGQFRAATSPALMSEVYQAVDRLAPVKSEDTTAQRRRDWRWAALLAALASIVVIGWRGHRNP